MTRPAFLSAFSSALVGGLGLFFIAWLAIALLPARLAPPLSFQPASFGDLAGWQDDNQAEALPAFLRTCEVYSRRPPSSPVAPALPGALAGQVSDWLPLCDLAAAIAPGDSQAARQYFEAHFRPLAILADGQPRGLFTGYYEPLIEGSLTADAAYPVPLYKRPPELVTVDLGLFRAGLKGRRIAGRVSGGRLTPIESRAEIEAGALAHRGLELLWLQDPVDAFNLHIQGSGRVRLAGGEERRVGYAGPNGHPYTSLGKLLVKRGLMAQEDVSAPAIWRWLRANPVAGARLMQENASFVFFRFLDDATGSTPGGENDGPIGAAGVALTPGRSLALDRSLLPLGAPYWLAASHPDPADPAAAALPLQRLLIAQDTGGAIRGAVRGDVFWGRGNKAETIAGHMANWGRLYLLLPKNLAPARRGESGDHVAKN